MVSPSLPPSLLFMAAPAFSFTLALFFLSTVPWHHLTSPLLNGTFSLYVLDQIPTKGHWICPAHFIAQGLLLLGRGYPD